MASTYLQKTLGTPTSQRIWTFSAWVKRSGISSTQHIFSIDNGSARDAFSFDSDNGLRLYFNSSTSPYADLSTNRVLRDTSSFYHLVIAVDTTQATADDRVKLYINGTQYTWDETTIDPALNYDTFNASGNTFRIGRDRTAANYFDGLMSYVAFVDGTQELPTIFGETDATTGEWKIKTTITPSVAWGNNGFLILKDGNSVTDQSGNSNNFTVAGGTLTNTEDCPSNVFATLNRLQRSRNNTNNGGDYLTQGNNTFDTSSSNGMKAVVLGTMGVQSGKYYWEYKVITNTRLEVGISQANVMSFTSPYYDLTTFSVIAITASGNIKGRFIGGSSWDDYATGTSNTTNDIIGLALDMDNKALYIHKNGTYLSNGTAVGVPTSGSSRTGSLIEPFAGSRDDYIPDGEFIFPYVHDVSTTGVAKAEFNFGNGYFGTTAISSEGTNASGNGKFEYDVPTGYTALSTKGLNE